MFIEYLRRRRNKTIVVFAGFWTKLFSFKGNSFPWKFELFRTFFQIRNHLKTFSPRLILPFSPIFNIAVQSTEVKGYSPHPPTKKNFKKTLKNPFLKIFYTRLCFFLNILIQYEKPYFPFIFWRERKRRKLSECEKKKWL